MWQFNYIFIKFTLLLILYVDQRYTADVDSSLASTATSTATTTTTVTIISANNSPSVTDISPSSSMCVYVYYSIATKLPIANI